MPGLLPQRFRFLFPGLGCFAQLGGKGRLETRDAAVEKIDLVDQNFGIGRP